MDSRVSSLIHVLKSEGLSAEDREAAHGFPSAVAAGNYADVLRGKLAEAGATLGSKAAHVHRGLAAGRVLLAGLLCEHGRCQRFPSAPLSPEEVEAYTQRMNVASMTCTRLLGLIGRVKNKVRERQHADALAAHLAKQAA